MDDFGVRSGKRLRRRGRQGFVGASLEGAGMGTGSPSFVLFLGDGAGGEKH